MRSYEERDITPDIKAEIIHATLRAPTAGNMMLYSIVEVTDQGAKDTLAKSCDNQPFIAKAPWVLLFLADYQRWTDYYIACGVPERCAQQNVPMRRPEEGDLMLACCDALIAAQTAVLAAESFGLGSCYIGDITEQYETHRDLFDLPQYVFPICLLCLGYPTQQQKEREQTLRFDRKFIVFETKYRRLDADDFKEMYRDLHARNFPLENPDDMLRLLGIDLSPVADHVRFAVGVVSRLVGYPHRAIAVGTATRAELLERLPGQAAVRLVAKVVEKQLVHQPLDAPLHLAGLRLGIVSVRHRQQSYAAELQPPDDALCLDLALSPEKLAPLVELSVRDFHRIYDHFDAMLKAARQPSGTWIDIPCTGKLHIPSCDVAAMISTTHFERFSLPCLRRELLGMDRAIYHVVRQRTIHE